MCEANAYLFKEGKEELILEDLMISVAKVGNSICKIYLENRSALRHTSRN